MSRDIQAQVQRAQRRVYAIAGRVPEAGRLALNRSVQMIRARVAREASQSTRLPLKTWQKKIYNISAQRGQYVAKLVMYRSPATAGRLFTPSRLFRVAPRGTNRRGVSARGYSWPGAFVNVPARTGKPLIMQRKGKARYPLEVLKIPVRDAVDAAYEKHQSDVMENDFPRLAQQAISYQMGRR